MLLAGCAPPPLQGVGRPTDVPRLAGPENHAQVEPTAAPIAPDFATRLARVGPDSFVSWGHAGGRYAATVYVTKTARDGVVAATEVAPGTEVVMTTVDRATHAPGPTLFMLKEPSSTWRFGTLETPEGPALCARCHAEAPRDHLFALPE